jgi:uncharacterized membrane protein YphA (DoxX/SURF4 family)
MTAENSTMAIGWRVYGLGLMAMAVVCLVWGGFDSGQPVPKAFPERAVLGTAVAAFMFIAGLAIQWRRTTAWAAAALTVYYALIVVVLMYGRLMLKHYAEYGTYESGAEPVAIAAAGLIVYAADAEIDPVLARRLTRVGQVVVGLCALVFGGAHFVFMNLTAPLVPKWLPPNQEFWAYATGVAQIAAGLAIISGIRARLAAILLTVMYASFTPLVHIPTLIADPTSRWNWSENAVNLALIGVAWVVADSLVRPRRT